MVLRGRDRNTRDVDLVVVTEPEALETLKTALRHEGFAHHDRVDSHALEGLTLYRFWLPIDQTGLSMALDIQHGRTLLHESVIKRADTLIVRGRKVKVASCEDLLLLKLMAFRPIDRAGSVGLLRATELTVELDYLRHWATQLEIEDRLREISLEIERQNELD